MLLLTQLGNKLCKHWLLLFKELSWNVYCCILIISCILGLGVDGIIIFFFEKLNVNTGSSKEELVVLVMSRCWILSNASVSSFMNVWILSLTCWCFTFYTDTLMVTLIDFPMLDQFSIPLHTWVKSNLIIVYNYFIHCWVQFSNILLRFLHLYLWKKYFSVVCFIV